MKQTAYLQINKGDNVVVCLRPINAGEEIKIGNHAVQALRNTPAFYVIRPKINLLSNTDILLVVPKRI